MRNKIYVLRTERPKLFSTAFVFILIISLGVAGCSPKPGNINEFNSAQRFSSHANSLVESKRLEDAIIIIYEGLDQFPDSTLLIRSKKRITRLLREKNSTDSIHYLTDSLKRVPKHQLAILSQKSGIHEDFTITSVDGVKTPENSFMTRLPDFYVLPGKRNISYRYAYKKIVDGPYTKKLTRGCCYCPGETCEKYTVAMSGPHREWFLKDDSCEIRFTSNTIYRADVIVKLLEYEGCDTSGD